MEDAPFIKSLHHLNTKQKDWYYARLDKGDIGTLNTAIIILLINFDNWLRFKFMRKHNENKSTQIHH